MSDRMGVAEARTFATGYGTTVVNEVRAARTVVAQAEQIERLQNALHKADKWGGEVLNNLIEDDIILPGDMEDPA